MGPKYRAGGDYIRAMLPFDTNVKAEGDECAWREYFQGKMGVL